MLFSIMIGLATAGIYALCGIYIKIKFLIQGGKAKNGESSACPYLIFAESKRYWNVFESICDEFEKRKVEVRYWTTSEDDPSFQKQYEYVKPEYIGSGNMAFARLNLLKADVVLSTTPGLDVLQWKRSRSVKYYVHILHAVGSAAGYRMFGIDYYDAMLLSGEYQAEEVRKLEELRNLPRKEICFVGQPYLDAMWSRKLAKVREEESSAERDPDSRTVLLAPSWGKNSILCRYGAAMIDALLATGYHIIIRPHPQSFTADKEVIEPLMKKYKDTDQLQWNRDNDNFDVLDQADIMITDFSGVIYDYVLIFDKPIIYADISFDHAPYDSAWISEPLWKFRILPKLGCPLKETDLEDLKSTIDHVITNDIYAKGREQARKEAWMFQGESAVRTVDYLMKKREELVPEEDENAGSHTGSGNGEKAEGADAG